MRKQVKGTWYPGITPQEGSKIEGVLYLAVEPKELELLHGFEHIYDNPPWYFTKNVEVKTEKGAMKAVVYVFSNPDNLEEGDWDISNFKETKFKEF